MIQENQSEIKCPYCSSEAIYRYGKTSNGRQRMICQVCNRQFTPRDNNQSEIKDRPICPNCGKNMHVYMKQKHYIWFRCSNYPGCRGYMKKFLEKTNESLYT
ncbi:MAG: topoisomerase DNA-binding C4 zinc finger domain-containing protein [Deltaproteobacteria bacterium]|nr:topoisomerase DNA-binding C4 zinc finger domain-containing protein [Deltaproteobacteria bacterium]